MTLDEDAAILRDAAKVISRRVEEPLPFTARLVIKTLNAFADKVIALKETRS